MPSIAKHNNIYCTSGNKAEQITYGASNVKNKLDSLSTDVSNKFDKSGSEGNISYSFDYLGGFAFTGVEEEVGVETNVRYYGITLTSYENGEILRRTVIGPNVLLSGRDVQATNTDGSIVSLLDISKSINSLIWEGTQAEYDALPTKESNKIYLIQG